MGKHEENSNKLVGFEDGIIRNLLDELEIESYVIGEELYAIDLILVDLSHRRFNKYGAQLLHLLKERIEHLKLKSKIISVLLNAISIYYKKVWFKY